MKQLALLVALLSAGTNLAVAQINPSPAQVAGLSERPTEPDRSGPYRGPDLTPPSDLMSRIRTLQQGLARLSLLDRDQAAGALTGVRNELIFRVQHQGGYFPKDQHDLIQRKLDRVARLYPGLEP